MVDRQATDQTKTAQGKPASPAGHRPWEDRTLSAPDRYASYDAVVRVHCQRIYDAGMREGVTDDERYIISQDPENRMWASELEQLLKETPEQFCYRIDGGMQRELLGKNFLGAEAWRSQGIDVGDVPPVPSSITKDFLNSECPLHPGQKIKDTHILVLIPKTVNGEPYTALKLDVLCATRKGSVDILIYDRNNSATAWKSNDWASTPQAQSEWVLLPKSDPSPSKVPAEKHFRSKNIAAQAKVHMEHYPEYREVKALEVMTMALLNDLVNGEPRILDGWNYLRCVEENAFGGRVCVGAFDADGLAVRDDRRDFHDVFIGRALARKLQT